MQEKEVRDKLNLVIEKLLNPGGPENEKELEESGGGTIGYFARDFGIQEWDWPQGVGLFGLLKVIHIAREKQLRVVLFTGTFRIPVDNADEKG